MIIKAYYYVTVLTSFYSTIGEDGIAFGDSKNRATLKNLAKAYSQQSDDLVLFGQVNDVPETAYYHGHTLLVGYDDELDETYYFIDGDEVLILKEADNGGFVLERQPAPCQKN